MRLQTLIHPDQGMFRLRCGGADPDGPQAPPVAAGALLSVGYDDMWIGSLQDDVEVTVVVEEWDGPPLPDSGDWEDEEKATLYLRGKLSIDNPGGTVAVGALRLLGGVGYYEVRACTRHRRDVARLYDELFDRYRSDVFNQEFTDAVDELRGVETYVVQLWRTN